MLILCLLGTVFSYERACLCVWEEEGINEFNAGWIFFSIFHTKVCVWIANLSKFFFPHFFFCSIKRNANLLLWFYQYWVYGIAIVVVCVCVCVFFHNTCSCSCGISIKESRLWHTLGLLDEWIQKLACVHAPTKPIKEPKPAAVVVVVVAYVEWTS